MELAKELSSLYDLQGKAERIKNTVFPIIITISLGYFCGCLPYPYPLD